MVTPLLHLQQISSKADLSVAGASSRRAPNQVFLAEPLAHPDLVHPPPCGLFRTGMGFVSRAWPVQTAMRNCTRDEGGPFEVGNQVLTSSHRKLLSSKAMVVNVAETSGHDPGRHD